MLCNVVENGKRKCEQYYPETAEETVRFGRFSILAREPVVTKNQQAFKITPLVIADGNVCAFPRFTRQEPRLLKLFKGDPQSGAHPLGGLARQKRPGRQLRLDATGTMDAETESHSRTLLRGYPFIGKLGIGRSGTIVGLDILCCRLANEELVTLKQVVTELRKMRDGAVQVDVQYIYMARCMVELALQQRVVTAIEMMSFVKAYEEFCTQHLCTTD